MMLLKLEEVHHHHYPQNRLDELSGKDKNLDTLICKKRAKHFSDFDQAKSVQIQSDSWKERRTYINRHLKDIPKRGDTHQVLKKTTKAVDYW